MCEYTQVSLLTAYSQSVFGQRTQMYVYTDAVRSHVHVNALLEHSSMTPVDDL